MSRAEAERRELGDTMLGFSARLRLREACESLAGADMSEEDIANDLTAMVVEETQRAIANRDAWDAKQRELDREDVEEELETKREQQRERELDATGGR